MCIITEIKNATNGYGNHCQIATLRIPLNHQELHQCNQIEVITIPRRLWNVMVRTQGSGQLAECGLQYWEIGLDGPGGEPSGGGRSYAYPEDAGALCMKQFAPLWRAKCGCTGPDVDAGVDLNLMGVRRNDKFPCNKLDDELDRFAMTLPYFFKLLSTSLHVKSKTKRSRHST